MKGMLFGIVLIIVLGLGGLAYRNITERQTQPIACPLDALVCPDGATVVRTGPSCTFPACQPPNVSFPDIAIAFAVPEGFAPAALPDAASVAAYESPHAEDSLAQAAIIIRRYAVSASSDSTSSPQATALDTIRQTAIGGASGLPISATRFTSTTIGNRRFTVVSIGRFEAVINTAYYLARGTDVLRFDAIDRDVADWTSPNLDVSALPAHAALENLLSTLQGR